jgi:Histidine kinase-, DNA gyrase B-, and HSP90-like ATPase
MLIKPGVNAAGFRVAVKDYTEASVIGELAANSYDADATTVLVLLDTNKNVLHVLDDGGGFSAEAFKSIATLGGGDKLESNFSKGTRHYLGSYGMGLKSTLNIANRIEVRSYSEQRAFRIELDWSRLEEALKANFEGYPHDDELRGNAQATGTIVRLNLKNPTTKDQLEDFGVALGDLPSDKGNFLCYFGLSSELGQDYADLPKLLTNLRKVAKSLASKNKLFLAGTSTLSDLEECEIGELTDRQDPAVKARFYFAGFDGDKVRSLKPSVRGIYVRIHGRLLKQDFASQEYTYNISKWIMFTQGLRVEIEVDWLRDQITLSREGLRFSNQKLASEFKAVLYRLISRFIQPYLKTIAKKKERAGDRLAKQRRELVARRLAKGNDHMIRLPQLGFSFRPETDGELGLLLAQGPIMSRVNKNFQLLDFNDKAPFDAIIWDRAKMQQINTEFEPTLMEFLTHREKDDVRLVIVWTTGKWRVGSRKKGRGGHFELNNVVPSKKGHFQLLEFASMGGKKPRKAYQVIALEELV